MGYFQISAKVQKEGPDSSLHLFQSRNNLKVSSQKMVPSNIRVPDFSKKLTDSYRHLRPLGLCRPCRNGLQAELMTSCMEPMDIYLGYRKSVVGSASPIHRRHRRRGNVPVMTPFFPVVADLPHHSPSQFCHVDIHYFPRLDNRMPYNERYCPWLRVYTVHILFK